MAVGEAACRGRPVPPIAMHKKRIEVEYLQLGMWVVELDRPWLGTPFDFQGFPVTSEEELESVKRYCKYVYVDPEREKAAAPPRRTPTALRATASTDATPVEQELVVAREVYDECEKAIRAVLEDLRVEGKLDADRLTAATADMTATIQRNPDVVILLHRLHQKGSYELRRAMDSSILMITFGRSFEFAKERLEVLGLAGMLLDVGKIRIPDDVLHKTGMLTPDEYQLMKSHVMHSVELVRSANGRLPSEVEEIILQHHERQDGNGYPQGLKGSDISVDGAIAAIVDSFSALTSERCFAEPMSPSSALNHLHEMRGQSFQDGLVEQFIQCIGVYPVGSAVELNTGEIGIVMTQNPVRRLQPNVMLVLDRNRKQLPHPQLILDLAKEPRTKTGEPYRIRDALPIQKLPIDAADFFPGWL